MANSPSARSRSPVQLAAALVGAVFLVVGVLGFVPGITSNVGSITFAGQESEAMLLGVFQVSILHNVVHLLFGVAGLAMSGTASGARTFLIAGGAVYLVLWLYGLLVAQTSGLNFVPVNTADDWLHLGLGAGMLLLGIMLGRSVATTRTTA